MSSPGNLPETVQRMSMALPFARGVSLLQELATGATDRLGWSEMSLLVLSTAAYLVGGTAFFVWAERVAKDRGLIGRY